MGRAVGVRPLETQRHRGQREELAQRLCNLRASVFQTRKNVFFYTLCAGLPTPHFGRPKVAVNDDLLRFWRPAVLPTAGSEPRAEHAMLSLRPRAPLCFKSALDWADENAVSVRQYSLRGCQSLLTRT